MLEMIEARPPERSVRTSPPEHGHSVRDFQRGPDVMSDQQCGHADLLEEALHALDKLGTRDGVEGSEGFVEQNDLWLCGQRACQGHSLPLTTR
jgi:hypothetical protein